MLGLLAYDLAGAKPALFSGPPLNGAVAGCRSDGDRQHRRDRAGRAGQRRLRRDGRAGGLWRRIDGGGVPAAAPAGAAKCAAMAVLFSQSAAIQGCAMSSVTSGSGIQWLGS